MNSMLLVLATELPGFNLDRGLTMYIKDIDRVLFGYDKRGRVAIARWWR